MKSFSLPGRSLETSVDAKLHGFVVAGLTKLLGSCLYFGSGVLTPYCYTLGMYTHTRDHICLSSRYSLQFALKSLEVFVFVDVEIKLDTEGQVLHVHENTGVKKR